MKHFFKQSLQQSIFILGMLCICIACGTSDDPIEELPPQPPTPEEPVIEVTENGSSNFVLLGYEDNVVEGGTLKPDGFSSSLLIKDKKLEGTSFAFAQCSGVKRLDAMPEVTTMTAWTDEVILVEESVFWVRETTDAKYRYLKLRIAYIEGNKVGVEYKVASVIERPKIEDIILTEEGAKAFVFTGYLEGTTGETGLLPEGLSSRIDIETGKFIGENYTFSSYADVTDLTKLPEVNTVTAWSGNASIAENKSYWLRYTTSQEYVYVKMRVAYIDGDNVGVEYKIASTEKVTNVNANIVIEGKPYVTDYSIPHLNPDNYYAEHSVTVDNQDIFNFALEWNNAKKHAAWVAFSFDDVTRKDKVSRSNAWSVDPQLPKDMQVDNDYHRSDGFDRGHICASEDRVYVLDANKQTFYFSNMTPQLNSFNGGFWAAFEKRVRDWGRYSYDKLYVTKGGTLDQLLVNFKGDRKGSDGIYPTTDENGLTIHGLACPKYYYMAVLSEKDGAYHAIAFWMEHRDDYGYSYGDNISADVLKKYALNIDELEEKTGIDFFCNLPDGIENAVESNLNLEDWAW